MSAVARYVASDLARSQRWLPPMLAYLVLCLINLAIGGASRGNALPTFASAAAALFPVAVWLAVVTGNCEDPVQASITVAAVGSEAKVRLAKLLVAYAGCVALALLSTAMGWLQTAAPLTDVGAGLAAHLMAAVVGVSVGAWCMRPLLDRRAWAVLAGVVTTQAEVLVPHCPPVRQLLVLFGEVHPAPLATGLALVATESVLIAVILVTGALSLGRSRN